MKQRKPIIVASNELLAKPRKSGPHYPMVKKTCICSNPFQDAQFGRSIRIHNTRMSNKELLYSCTSCGKGSRPSVKGFKFPINGRNPA